MQRAYEARIKSLENKLDSVQKTQTKNAAAAKKAAPATSTRGVKDNSFNPSIGVILNGKASSFSRGGAAEIAGFGVGEEGERGQEGLAVDESELNFSANIDDKFTGSMTLAIVREGGADGVELEEVYFQTLPDAGLPDGTRITAGRKFWTLGYLNEQHAHADDFADRPLPYRIYLNKAFNDDGLEAAWVVPTDDLFVEFGGGIFRGADFPGGGANGGNDSWSAYARVGGDIGSDQSWRLGVYTLQGDVHSRASNGDMVTFSGKSNLYAADLRYTWAPTGNARESEVILQAEYFHRDEEGTYNDADAGTGTIAFDDDSSGFYAQGVYKFAPAWRAGVRYSKMFAPGTPAGLVGSALDADGHDPESVSVMLDWTNSEFGRLRGQYNREELSKNNVDHQFFLQYIMSFGAHGAHPY